MASNLRGKFLHAAIKFSAGSSFLLFGYDQGVLGGLVTEPSFLKAIGNPSSSFLGIIVALYNIGCLAGCIVAGLVGNKIGRKKSIIYGNIIMIIGGILQTAIYGSTQLIIGRLVSGVSNGMITSTVPMYVSECSPAKARGRAVAIQMSTVIFGTVTAYWLDYGCIRNQTGEVVWRFPIAFQNVFSLITLSTLPFLPETPRWLYAHNCKDEAIHVLSRLYHCSKDDPAVKKTEVELEASLQVVQEATKLSLRDLINDKSPIKNTRRLILCFLIQFWQQFTGINVIAFYVTIVLETNVGLLRETSSLVDGCIQIAFWLGTFPPMYLLDKVGRGPNLMLGSGALLVSMIVFTAGIAICFGMSWNSIPWLYAPEITTLKLRHVGAATATFSEWLWTFVIALITPYAIETAGWKFYLLFGMMIFLSGLFTFFFLPETSGKTLEEMDYIFSKGSLLDESSRIELGSHADKKAAVQHDPSASLRSNFAAN